MSPGILVPSGGIFLPTWHFFACINLSLDPIHYLYYNAVLMKNLRLLGSFESLLLLAVLRRSDDAYGVTIRRELIDNAERDVSIGAIYTGLGRLEQKGFVTSSLGEPTPERGGRAKRYYRITPAGLDALNHIHRSFGGLVDGMNLALENDSA
ncbi:MAG TPA: PadR family transcriptional regulator [Blastocatellia bacterium]|nr:PadR family transcriptional regulator [Blastocatellia bacterium]